MPRHIREEIYRFLFAILAFASLIFLVGIVLTLFREAIPLFSRSNVLHILLGRAWYPTSEPPDFGMLPLISASIAVTLGAMIVCIPVGIGTALYLHEIASSSQRAFLKPMIEVLAGIPSIVYGFFGMVIVAPFLQSTLGIPKNP